LVRIAAVVVAIVATVLLTAAPAIGASACATAVLRDWSEDGLVGPKYSLPCYEEAIDSLPTDLRDYTDAEDVIGRALTSAVRTSNPAQSDAGASAGVASTPLALVGLAGVTLFVLSAGGLGYVARRRRGLGEPGSGTE
jgi:hypothetical protein